MPDYTIMQEIAQSQLFKRLQDKHVRQLHKYITIRQMLNHLDKEFRITTKIGLAAARDDYQKLRFRSNNDKKKKQVFV